MRRTMICNICRRSTIMVGFLLISFRSSSHAFLHQSSTIFLQQHKRPSPSLVARLLATTSTSSKTNASNQQPQKRTKGKNRAQELAALATNLKVDPSKLKQVLQRKRLQLKDDDDNSEKAKYIDWLLKEEKEIEGPTVKETQTQKQNQRQNTKPNQIKKKKKNQNQPSFLTTDNFADRKDIHPASKRALSEILKVTSMTEIQSKTFAPASSGRDVLGRARTGTGKTVAFLLPTLERILHDHNNNNQQQQPHIHALIVSPTRELAMQIGDQAEKLLTYHPNLSAQVVFGGTNMNRDINQFHRQLPTILAATPGRLLDHLKSTTIKGKGQFGRDIMCHTPIVVLDEGDRLLDMGFRNEIKKILSFLPNSSDRQTLLFSATIPKELKGIMAENMKADYVEVDCINDGQDDSHTSTDIDQSHIVVPSMDRYVSSVVEIVRFAMQQDDQAKIVVFFPTARMVAFFAEFFNEGLQIPVIELHSKKSQSYRNRASDQFRSAAKAILFTSDVSARGVDYPGVSQVIQFGMPDNREQYIHRLGRTGRAGTTGKGWLVLGPFESLFLQELKGVDVPMNDALLDLLNNPIEMETNEMFIEATDRIRNGKKRQSSAKRAYQAFLGFYLGKMKRIKMRNKNDLVSIANEFSFQMGLPEVPSLTKHMVGKMGLKGVDGISIEAASTSDDSSSSRRGSKRRDHGNGRRKPKTNRF